jgi:hypothetical protein
LTEFGTGIEPNVARFDSLRDFIDELRAHSQSEDRLLYQWADAHLDEAHRVLATGALSLKTGAIAKNPTA